MYTTDLTFQQLGKTVLACGRIRVMVSKYVKINKKILLFIMDTKRSLSYRGKEYTSKTGHRGKY